MSDDLDATGNISGLDCQFEFKSPNQRQETASDECDRDHIACKENNQSCQVSTGFLFTYIHKVYIFNGSWAYRNKRM